jgi:peptidoglycan/LPS O-acetylase OafA/YrhL
MAAFFLLRHPIRHLLLATDLEARRALVARFTDIFRLRPLFGAHAPWLDRLSVSFFVTGLATALVFLALLPVLDRYVRPLPASLARKIRLVADSTFTLYLVHLPFFNLAYAIHGRAFVSWRAGLALLAAAVAFSVVLAAFFDRLKNTMRRRLRTYFQLA